MDTQSKPNPMQGRKNPNAGRRADKKTWKAYEQYLNDLYADIYDGNYEKVKEDFGQWQPSNTLLYNAYYGRRLGTLVRNKSATTFFAGYNEWVADGVTPNAVAGDRPDSTTGLYAINGPVVGMFLTAGQFIAIGNALALHGVHNAYTYKSVLHFETHRGDIKVSLKHGEEEIHLITLQKKVV